MNTVKRFACLLLACLLLTALPVSAEESTRADLPYTILQCDARWKDITVGLTTIREAGCGIASLCNAIYFLTGNEPDLVEIAVAANRAELFNARGTYGVYHSVYAWAARVYGSTYGFTTDGYRVGTSRSRDLQRHLQSGGTAVIRTPGHLMAVIAYDAQKDAYLVIDPEPGDQKYDRRRLGLTHSGGDWLSAETLLSEPVQVTGYALLSRVLSENEKASVLPTVTAVSLRGIGKD